MKNKFYKYLKYCILSFVIITLFIINPIFEDSIMTLLKWLILVILIGIFFEDYFKNKKLNDGQLSTFDQQQQQADLAANNQMERDGRIIERNPKGFYEDEDGQIWNDVETGDDVLVPLTEVAAWEQAKNTDPASTPKVVSRVYGKTEVTGTMDANGNLTVSQPMAADQANTLKAEVEQATAGKATILSTPIDEADPTNPLYNVSIVPN